MPFIRTSCLLLLLAMPEVKVFGQIKLIVTVTNVSATLYYDATGQLIFYNGGINVSASGGTQPYQYELPFPYGNIDFSNGYFPRLDTGTYKVVVTDAKGQEADTTVTVSSIYPIPSVRFSNVVLPSSCGSTDGSFTLVGIGGTPPYTYSIDGGVTFTPDGTFNHLPGGYYTPCFAKDAHGLLAFASTYEVNLHFDTTYPPYFFCDTCSFTMIAYSGGVRHVLRFIPRGWQ